MPRISISRRQRYASLSRTRRFWLGLPRCCATESAAPPDFVLARLRSALSAVLSFSAAASGCLRPAASRIGRMPCRWAAHYSSSDGSPSSPPLWRRGRLVSSTQTARNGYTDFPVIAQRAGMKPDTERSEFRRQDRSPGRILFDEGETLRPERFGQRISGRVRHAQGRVGRCRERQRRYVVFDPRIGAAGNDDCHHAVVGSVNLGDGRWWHAQEAKGRGFRQLHETREREAADSGEAADLLVLERRGRTGGVAIDQLYGFADAERLERFFGHTLAQRAARARNERLASEIREVLDRTIAPYHPMDGLCRNREQGADAVVVRILHKRFVAAARLANDARRRGENISAGDRIDVGDVLDRALAFGDNQGVGAVAGKRQGLGELLGQNVIRTIRLAGVHRDRHFRGNGGCSHHHRRQQRRYPQADHHCPKCRANRCPTAEGASLYCAPRGEKVRSVVGWRRAMRHSASRYRQERTQERDAKCPPFWLR